MGVETRYSGPEKGKVRGEKTNPSCAKDHWGGRDTHSNQFKKEKEIR